MTALFTKTGETSADLRDAVERTVMELLSRQILTEMTPEQELAAIGVELAEKRDRDPAERRLLPAIERYFQFQATRMDRCIVACYDSEVGGHWRADFAKTVDR